MNLSIKYGVTRIAQLITRTLWLPLSAIPPPEETWAPSKFNTSKLLFGSPKSDNSALSRSFHLAEKSPSQANLGSPKASNCCL